MVELHQTDKLTHTHTCLLRCLHKPALLEMRQKLMRTHTHKCCYSGHLLHAAQIHLSDRKVHVCTHWYYLLCSQEVQL